LAQQRHPLAVDESGQKIVLTLYSSTGCALFTLNNPGSAISRIFLTVKSFLSNAMAQ